MCKNSMSVSGVYCLKNILNGKIYVGQSINIYRRLLQHHTLYDKDVKNSHLYNAIKKYGTHNFDVTILEVVNDINVLNEIEAKWIKEFDSCNREHGYNNRIEHGDHYKHSIETKEKIRDARKGYIMPDKHKANLEHTFYTKDHKLEDAVLQKRNIAIKKAWADGKFDNIIHTANSGSFKKGAVPHNKNKQWSDEHKAKLSKAHTGKKLSETHKKAIVEGRGYNAIYQFNFHNILIKKYDIISDIPIITNNEYRAPGIAKCCNGGSKYYKDFVFKYEKDITLVEIEWHGKTVTSFIYNDGTSPERVMKSRATRRCTGYNK